MPSPFPGMDPYLEHPAICPDFHLTPNTAMRAQLNKSLPERYAARVDRYLWIEDLSTNESQLLGKPDVYVSNSHNGAPDEGGAISMQAPATATLPALTRERKSFLKIIDARSHRVITVIELLSPTNKTPGKDHAAYLAKRDGYLASGVNLVEIDLLRAGQRPPCEEALPPADYYILVSRASDFPKAGVWPISVRDSLPDILAPLSPGDSPVELHLQSCLDRAYDEGRYLNEIDYAVPPEPPLSDEDAVWAQDLLRNVTL